MKSYLLITVFSLLWSTSFCQPGSLDLSFGSGGIAKYKIGSSGSITAGLSLQEDGKLIILTPIGIVRFDTNGKIDSSFGTNGIAAIVNLFSNDFGINDCIGQPIAIQNDGKILVSGEINNDMTVERFTIDGAVDSTFADNGIKQINTGVTSCRNILFHNDRIIIQGGSFSSSAVVVCLNLDGSLDQAFGISGKVKLVNTSASNIWMNALTIDSNNNIILGGSKYGDSSAIVRIKWNGDLDSSFAVDGVGLYHISDYQEFIYDLKVQKDNKIIATGWYYYSNYGPLFTVLRLNPSGSLDSSFGNAGVVLSNFFFQGKSIMIQPDKKIIITGTDDWNQVKTVRVDSTGNFDSGFGGNGIIETVINSSSQAFTSMGEIQSDGKIIISGSSYDSIFVIRYNGNDVATGNGTPINKNSLFIYPNPAQDFLQLPLNSYEKNIEVNIYDLIGRRIDLPEEINNSILKIDVRTLNDGLYLLEVLQPETQSKFSLKFTKVSKL